MTSNNPISRNRVRPHRLVWASAPLVLAVAMTVAAWLPPSSQAATTHQFLGKLGEQSGQGLPANMGLAVDDETGNVFIAQKFVQTPVHGSVEIFGPTGAPPAGITNPEFTGFEFPPLPWRSSLAVANAGIAPSHELFVADSGNHVVKRYAFDPVTEDYGLNGVLTPSGAGIWPFAVAVSAANEIYVAGRENVDTGDPVHPFISVFNAAGAEIERVTLPEQMSLPGTLAFDQAGDLYLQVRENVTQQEDHGPVYKYLSSNDKPDLTSTPQIVATDAVGIASDLQANSLYVARQQEVLEYDMATDRRQGVFGKGTTSNRAVAVNAQTGIVYVAQEFGTSRWTSRFGPTIQLPNVVTNAAAGQTSSQVTLTGTVDPLSFELEACYFEWGATNAYGHVAPCQDPDASEIAPNGGPVDVRAVVSGLHPGQRLHYRLITEVSLGPGQTGLRSEAEDESTSTRGPLILNTRASEASDTSVKLEGRVNPNGESTTYQFQYVPEQTFEATGFAGASAAPAAPLELTSGASDVSVSEELLGLIPGTTYRFRLVAQNGSATLEGELDEAGVEIPHTFTTYPPRSGLPDGRAYEQATPIEKNGSSAQGGEYRVRAAADGSAVAYYITAGAPGGEGGQLFPSYVAVREDGRWTSHGLVPPSKLGVRVFQSDWSQDLRSSFSRVWNPGETATFYDYEPVSTTARPIATGIRTDEPGELNEQNVQYDGESKDGSRVLFESTAALVEEAVAGKWNLYIWDKPTGAVNLVSVLPDGSGAPSGGFAGPWDYFNQYRNRGGATQTIDTQDMHVVSNAGTEAFFTTANVNQLYVRKDMLGPSPVTLQVSASQKTNGTGPGGQDPNGPKPASFMTATPNGNFAFFTSPGALTNDATTGPHDEGNDLYRFDTESGALVDIAPSTESTSEPAGAEIQGVLGVSDDGSYVYFVANGVLTSAPNPEGDSAGKGDCKSSPVFGYHAGGTCNLYVWHAGSISYIAKMHPGGNPGDEEANWIWSRNIGQNLPIKPSRVSADGSALLFAASSSPTDYDTQGANEFYRYDNSTDALACVSCNPSGVPPVGGATLQDMPRGYVSPAPINYALLRSFSAAGTRVFFESPEKLTPTDTNGVKDVYEWEADGTGTCTEPGPSGGCIFLISSGSSPDPSYFVDADLEGRNVFFFTTQSLVRQDEDSLRDVYDARIDGGLGYQEETPAPPCDGEDSCRDAVPVPPAAAKPGPPSGEGNVKARAACRKSLGKGKKAHNKGSKKQQHGKKACVKRKRAKGRRRGSHHRRHPTAAKAPRKPAANRTH